MGLWWILVAFAVLVCGVWLWGERWRPVRLSTLAFLRQADLKLIFSGKILHSYVYGRWIYAYISVLRRSVLPRLSPRGKQRLADHYHGKVIPHEEARSIISLDISIPLQDLEQVIPYATARKLVLDGPPDVAAFDCACRKSLDHHCEPLQVCMLVGQPFVDFMLAHNPATTRRLTTAEALQLLDDEHRRGHVHTAWFKNVMLDRFYAICNCCSCCCGSLEAMKNYGVPMWSSSGYVAEVDEAACTACGTCVEVCPFAAISVNGTASVNREACMGCGVCGGQCPDGAMSLALEPSKGLPLDVRLLASGAGAQATHA